MVRGDFGKLFLPFQVALITAINFSHSSTGKGTHSIAMQCVQTAEGKIYSMKVSNVMGIQNAEIEGFDCMSGHIMGWVEDSLVPRAGFCFCLHQQH